MLSSDLRQLWQRDGFFILPAFAEPTDIRAIVDETLDAVRASATKQQTARGAFRAGELIITLEGQPDLQNAAPESRISKVFNSHLVGAAKRFSEKAAIGELVSDLYDGDDVDVFQSQFIFKNPGAWGQPWHQDSYYFRFDQQPQIGVWLALSDATLENGCLAVLPGSHHEPLHAHEPDPRPGANYGYLEIFDHDFSAAQPVLMKAGDLLVFHSYLMHRSFDNRSTGSRMAMVYHYARGGTQLLAGVDPVARQVLHFRRIPR